TSMRSVAGAAGSFAGGARSAPLPALLARPFVTSSSDAASTRVSGRPSPSESLDVAVPWFVKLVKPKGFVWLPASLELWSCDTAGSRPFGGAAQLGSRNKRASASAERMETSEAHHGGGRIRSAKGRAPFDGVPRASFPPAQTQLSCSIASALLRVARRFAACRSGSSRTKRQQRACGLAGRRASDDCNLWLRPR